MSHVEVFVGIGHASVDHVAVQVPSVLGTIDWAVLLFLHLGYTEDLARRKEGEWGTARFLVNGGSIRVQLTMSTDPTEIPVGENHVAISVVNPKKVADEISRWVFETGLGKSIIEKFGENYFVTLPSLLAQSLELVPTK